MRLPSDSKAVLVFIFPYYNINAAKGNVSCYCAVKDYHITVMLQLKSICQQLKQAYPNHQFESFVDASPIDEVDAAVKGGLGVKGKNSLLITPQYGSYVFIGEIVTTLDIQTKNNPYAFCSGCNLCIKACPGQCIGLNGIEKEKCASYISQKKQELSSEEIAILKKANTVFGCDICQNVCPHNKNISGEKNLFSDDIVNTVEKQTVQDIYKDRAFGFRGLKVLQRNLDIFEAKE